ncbi:curli assembly protein CsgF, partial [Sphingomonas solaris]
MILRVSLLCLIGASAPALAEIVYQPVNPSFGGNPFNSSHLLGIANAQNDYKDPASTA